MPCLFCEIIAERVPSRKVYEDEKILAILDIYPANLGHLLVLSKKHYPNFVAIDDDLAGYLGLISKRLAFVQISNLKAEGVTLLMQEGTAAGQRAPHFVLHIIPRRANDRFSMTTQGATIAPAELEKGLAAIRKDARDTGNADTPEPSGDDAIETRDTDENDDDTDNEDRDDNDGDEHSKILDVIGDVL